jgi:hypothetical protein
MLTPNPWSLFMLFPMGLHPMGQTKVTNSGYSAIIMACMHTLPVT